MTSKLFLGVVVFLSLVLPGCSLAFFGLGHMSTTGQGINIIPKRFGRPSSCTKHKDRAEICALPYAPFAFLASKNPVCGAMCSLALVPIDIACSPITFLWGVESGMEHKFSSKPKSIEETPIQPVYEKEEKSKVSH